MRIPSNKGPDRGGQVDRTGSSSSKKTADSSTASGASGNTGNVTASVSARARSLASDHGVDLQKVDRLRGAIQDGSFKMDFRVVAERIVQAGA